MVMMKTASALLISILLILFAGCERGERAPSPQGTPPASLQRADDDIRLLREALKDDPGNLAAWIKLGNTLMDSGRNRDAADAYEKALAIDPKNVDVRVDMGTCYRNSGRPEKAVEAYRKAIEINPRHINAHRNLGVVLAYDLGDRAGAVREFEEYLKLYPSAPDAQQVRQDIEALKMPPPK